eukprot:2349328-Prymnesium_polylepis.1
MAQTRESRKSGRICSRCCNSHRCAARPCHTASAVPRTGPHELVSPPAAAGAARRLHQCTSRALDTLELGPDGRTSQRLGRACVCWECGHVGLPLNAAQCSERRPLPAGECAQCRSADQTNFVRVVRADGSACPWIEANVEMS